MRRWMPFLLVLAAASGCHRKTHHPADAAPIAPGLSVKLRKLGFHDKVAAYELVLQGGHCKQVEARLLAINSDGVLDLSHHTFSKLAESFEGTLCLLTQDGEPFGKKGQSSYSLGESVPAGTKTATSSGSRVFEGPYASITESSNQQVSCPPGRDIVVLVRCMSKLGGAGMDFPADLDALKKHAAESKDEIVTLVLRWESQ